jgi:hypothetical protein
VLVTKAKAAVNDSKVIQSLVQISRDYVQLSKMIKKMESSKYSIVEAYNDLNNLDFKQDSAKISNYITKRLEKNKDLDDIVHVKNTRTVSPALLAELQCCQPTSAAVERSFSLLGKILRKDRNFLPSNIGKYVCLNYNKV